ncbi:MAG: hypothetical protein HYT31_02375 [Parcubacteria group bacterium]|nr:hypothetical protein [Parcubacteria group bacterium]
MSSPAAAPAEQLQVDLKTGAIMRSVTRTDFLASARGHHRYPELHAMMVPLKRPVRAELINADHPVTIVGVVKQRSVVFVLAGDGRSPIPIGSDNIKDPVVRVRLLMGSTSNGKPARIAVPTGNV